LSEIPAGAENLSLCHQGSCEGSEKLVQIGHQQQAVSSLQHANLNARIVFVLDGSGSMMTTGLSRWLVALQTAMDVVSTAPDGTRFGVVTIGGPGERQFELTDNKKSTLELIRSFKDVLGKGRSPLYDAIARAVTMLQPPMPGDAIFLFTDGGENESKIVRSKLVRELDTERAKVLGIVFQNDLYGTREESAGKPDVRDLVERTGGQLYLVSDDTLRIDHPAKVIVRRRSLLPVWAALLYHPYVVDVQAGDKTESVKISLAHSERRLKSSR
jgi:Mg-chelatase subunit ChlD